MRAVALPPEPNGRRKPAVACGRFAHAKAAGATIVSEIEQHGYRAYTAEDLEGHRWTFVQARPTMS